MKNIKIYLIVVLISTIATNINADISSANFLKEETGARSLGMGSAFCAVSDDTNNVLVNPAGLNLILFPEISAMYRSGLIDSYYSFIAYAQPFLNGGVVEFSFLLYEGGNIEIINLDETSQTLKAEEDWVFTVGYGNNISETLLYGINLKAIGSNLVQQYNANAYAADIGLLFRSVDSSISLGASLQNIGTKMTYDSVGEPLPFTVRMGVAYKLRDTNTDSWLLAGDSLFLDNKFKYNFGLECSLFKNIFIRAGYKINYEPNYLTLGAGLNILQLQFDYAYASLGTLDSTHRISLTYKFDTASPVSVAEKYYEKGMSERALYLFKTIKKEDANYNSALKYIDDIEKEKEDKRQAEIDKALEIEKQAEINKGIKQKEVEAKINERLEREMQQKLKEERKKTETKEENANKEGMTNGLSDTISTLLFQTKIFVVLERAKMNEILKEQAFQMSGCTTTECAVEVGKTLNVRYILVGSLSKINNSNVVNIRIVDVESSELISAEMGRCSPDQDMIGVLENMINKIASSMPKSTDNTKPKIAVLDLETK